MMLFLSTYVFKIDKKNRISLPSSFRSILNEKNKIELVLFKSLKYQSIEGCGYGYIDDIAKRIDKLDIFSLFSTDVLLPQSIHNVPSPSILAPISLLQHVLFSEFSS